jgi:hypothetical protein
MASVSTTDSSSLTNIPGTHDRHDHAANEPPGHGPSAIPENEKTELAEAVEDDWQDDPLNPRNWSWGKKWTSAAVVRD